MKTTDKFTPYTLSIYKLCEKTDKLNYFNQIKNRILREIDEDESLGDFVKLSIENLNDIFLDNDGMCIFSDILMGYFEEQFIKDLWMYMRNLNKASKNEYDLQHMFNNFNIPDLLKIIKEGINYYPNDEKTRAAKQLIIERAEAELKKRNVIDWSLAIGKTILNRATQL